MFHFNFNILLHSCQSICRLLKIACRSYEVVLSTMLQTISKLPSPTRDRLVALQELGLVCIRLTHADSSNVCLPLLTNGLPIYIELVGRVSTLIEFIVLLFNVNGKIKPRIKLLCGWGQENLESVWKMIRNCLGVAAWMGNIFMDKWRDFIHGANVEP